MLQLTKEGKQAFEDYRKQMKQFYKKL